MNTKKITPALLVLLPLSLFLLASAFSYGPRLQGDEPKKEERSVAPFSKIGMGISADVYYTQETPQKLVLEGSAKDLEKIITEVKDGKLKISTKPSFNGNMDKVKIFISSAQLEEIGLSGSGNILAEGTVNTESFRAAVSGSGNITFKNLKAKKVETALSGSGDITLSGSEVAEKVSVAISGSGDINMENFVSADVEIAISGSGDCLVNAEKSLNCAISGSGDVGYKGKPVVNVKISGSGKVKSL
jgi:hypothetical protein